ncbi:carboxypeptidase-like regulatory domain-containing protein [Blastochloris sulfoviridis]|uniref:carboxypeptidase-like regulatory domain-containing protein n=1 Tax=Blastochloris sulfoviridis TaxID=50712 RepID=UPI0014786209|nr:carboxypeptidase-like regulatory domain-containing protein [Blastochloris sulfoviridis]
MTARSIVLLAMLLNLAMTGPAAAHRLKLFVTVEGNTVSGYAFFIGGGRPQGVAVTIRDAANAVVHRGTTDDAGGFAWSAAPPGAYTVSVDTGDGHAVSEKISADRFAGPAAPSPAAAPAEAAPEQPLPQKAAAEKAADPAPAVVCAPPDPAALHREVETAVDRALARQLRPLIEAQAQAEGRLRFNDIMGGIGMIVGLAGAGMWAAARRRRTDTGTPP